MIGINSPEAIEKLHHQHVLLDANLFIEAVHAPSAFDDLITGLEQAKCQPVLFPLVTFEIFRNIYQPEIRAAQDAYLKLWNCYSLPMQPQIFDDALALGNYYAARKKTPSITDCFIGALLKQHPNDLLLLTRNHKDFPEPLFVRELIWTTQLPGDVLSFGFYRFRRENSHEIEKYRDSSQ